jgi:hypothetical protein
MSSWSDFFSFSNCLVTWLASPLCRVMASRTGVAHTSNASRKARVSIGTNQGRICSKNCSSPRVILSLPLRLLRCFRFFSCSGILAGVITSALNSRNITHPPASTGYSELFLSNVMRIPSTERSRAHLPTHNSPAAVLFSLFPTRA